MPSACRREELQTLERLATEDHRPGGVVIVIVEFDCRRAATAAMNTPGVGDAVRAAEAEMAILSFVVAAESLINVIIVGALLVQRTERGVAFVGEHIGTAAVIRTYRRFLTVRVNRIFGIDQQLLDANMAALIHPERVAGKPGFQLVDIRDRTV